MPFRLAFCTKRAVLSHPHLLDHTRVIPITHKAAHFNTLARQLPFVAIFYCSKFHLSNQIIVYADDAKLWQNDSGIDEKSTKSPFQSWISTFFPMFLLPNDRLWDLTLWVWSVASSAWERRRSDQSWNLVGTTLQITSEDLMPQRSAPAFTFVVGALILTGSCECLCLRLREWRIAGLIASSRLNDRRSQNFWTCYSPLCLLKLFFWKVTVVTRYLGLGTLIFTLGSYHGDKCGVFFCSFPGLDTFLWRILINSS